MDTNNITWTTISDHRTWGQIYDEAVVLSRQHPGVSCVTLQRSLNLGYPRASRLLLELKQRGDYVEAPEEVLDAEQ